MEVGKPKAAWGLLEEQRATHVQHQDFQGQQRFNGLTLPWKDEGVRPPNPPNSSIVQRQQMRNQQPDWFEQQQQLVGGKRKLLSASLVDQQEGDEQPQLLCCLQHLYSSIAWLVGHDLKSTSELEFQKLSTPWSDCRVLPTPSLD